MYTHIQLPWVAHIAYIYYIFLKSTDATNNLFYYCKLSLNNSLQVRLKVTEILEDS